MQRVLRQRPHHQDAHGQAGAAVRRERLSRKRSEEEVQDKKVSLKSNGGENSRWRKEETTRQSGWRGGGSAPAGWAGSLVPPLLRQSGVDALLFPRCRTEPRSSWTEPPGGDDS